MPVCCRCHCRSSGWAKCGGVTAIALKSPCPATCPYLRVHSCDFGKGYQVSRIVLSELTIANLAHNGEPPSDVLASGTLKSAAFGSSISSSKQQAFRCGHLTPKIPVLPVLAACCRTSLQLPLAEALYLSFPSRGADLEPSGSWRRQQPSRAPHFHFLFAANGAGQGYSGTLETLFTCYVSKGATSRPLLSLSESKPFLQI